jgi:hypothetical protein
MKFKMISKNCYKCVLFFLVFLFLTLSSHADFTYAYTNISKITVPGSDPYYFFMRVYTGTPNSMDSLLYSRTGIPVGCFQVVQFFRCDAVGNIIDPQMVRTDFDLLGRLSSYAYWLQQIPSLTGRMVSGPSVRYCCYSKAYGRTDIYVNDIITGLCSGDFLATDDINADRIFHYRSSILGILATTHVSHTWGMASESVTLPDGRTVSFPYMAYTGKYDVGPEFKTSIDLVEDAFNCPGISYRKRQP